MRKNAKETYLLVGKLFCGLCAHRYVGNRQCSGRSKSLLVTYRRGRRHDTGETHCENKDVNRGYLEDFVLKRIGEIVFDESRIPALIQTYYDSCGDLIGEAADRLRELRQSLKVNDERIANIVNVISATGCAALAQSLEELEQTARCCASRSRTKKPALWRASSTRKRSSPLTAAPESSMTAASYLSCASSSTCTSTRSSSIPNMWRSTSTVSPAVTYRPTPEIRPPSAGYIFIVTGRRILQK